jgi:hypothetical protein
MLDLYAGDLNDAFGQEEQTRHLWLLLSIHGDKLIEDHIKPLAVIAYYGSGNAARHNAVEMLRRILPYEPVFTVADGEFSVSGLYVGEDDLFRRVYEVNPSYYTYDGVNSPSEKHS